MHPILFELGPFVVHTYGVLVALGFVVALWLTGREAERQGLDGRRFHDLGFLVLATAILGSRLFYVLEEWQYFARNPLQVFAIWRGGLVFYGGLVCAALAAIWFAQAKRLPLWGTLDAIAPGLALGQALGRVGCFLAGCCYGSECRLPWAVTFADPRGLAPIGTPLHPAQLYEAFADLAIFALLYFWLRTRKRSEGRLFGAYLVSYPAARFVIEFFRSDPRGSFGPLSTSQALGIPLFLFGLWALLRSRGSAPREP